MRFNFNLDFEKPKWLIKIFPCRHELVHIKTNPFGRYETKTSYIACLKCGRELNQAQKNCKHSKNGFGICFYCHLRLNPECKNHDWVNEPDTEDFFCNRCGTWQDEDETEH